MMLSENPCRLLHSPQISIVLQHIPHSSEEHVSAAGSVFVDDISGLCDDAEVMGSTLMTDGLEFFDEVAILVFAQVGRI